MTSALLALALFGADAAAPPRPVLLAARYTATLAGSDLIGRGEWDVASSGRLPLEPLSIALDSCTWAGGEAARLRRDQGRTWLEADAAGTVAFAWSARGREEPGAIRLNLELPAAAVAVLELDLPLGQAVTAADALLSGPLPGPAEGRAQWRILCGGRTRLDLLVRAADRREPVRATRTATYAPGEGRVRFEFDVEALRGPVQRLNFRVDAGLRVLEVQAPHRRHWHFDMANRTLSVDLREPANAARIVVLAALDSPGSPELRPLPVITCDGPMAGDAVEIRIHPDWTLTAWEPGDYLLNRSTPTPDRGYSLIFGGGWAGADGVRRMPGVAVRPSAAELRLNADLLWQPGATRNRLSLRVLIHVQHGPVAALSLRLPAGYRPGLPRLLPDDTAAVAAEGADGLWTIEPARPWTTGQVVELRLDAIGPVPEWSGNRATLPVPRLAAATPAAIESRISIRCEPPCRIRPTAGFESDADGTLRRTIGPREQEIAIQLERSPPPPAAATKAAGEQPPARRWQFESLSVQMQVRRDGSLLGTLSGMVRDRDEAELAIVLPAGATPLDARVDGRWQDAPAAADGTVRLHLPAEGQPSFEVRFRMPWQAGLLISNLPEVRLRLPGGPTIPTTWQSERPYWLLDSAGSAPRLLHAAGPAAAGAAVAVLAAALLLRLRRRRIPTAIAAAIIVSMPASVAGPRQPQAPAEVAFTRAVITARDDDSHLMLELRLTVIVSGTNGQHAVLPVRGLLLEAAELNGTVAFPQAGDGGRLTLTLPGPGWHEVLLRGRAPVAVRGAERECVLPLDALPMARLHFVAPAGVDAVSVPARQGAMRVEQGETLAATVDLGAVDSPVVRWHSAGTTDRPPRASVSTATIWDVSAASAQATAAFLLHDGTVAGAELLIDLPAELEPGRIRVRTPAGDAAIRGATLRPGTDGRMTLALTLHDPLPPAAVVTVRCHPTKPLAVAPRLFAVNLLGADHLKRVLFVRTSEQAENWEHSGCEPAAALPREFAGIADLNGPGDSRAFAITTESGAWVQPRARSAAVPPPRQAEMIWLLGRNATVEGCMRWHNADAAAAVDFLIPPGMTIAELKANDLAGWSRQGGRVRVWFRTPQRDIAVRWFGTWPDYRLGTDVELPVPPAVPLRFVQLHADAGHRIEIKPSPNWTSFPSLAIGVRNLLPHGAGPLTVRVQPVAP